MGAQDPPEGGAPRLSEEAALSKAEAIYQSVIMDHHRAPRNRGELPCPPAIRADGDNPLCGDRLTLFLALDGERIAEARFAGQGCAISQASASMLTEAVGHLSLAEARALADALRALIAGGEPAASLGDLMALAPVAGYPARHRCATLAWETLDAALTRPGLP